MNEVIHTILQHRSIRKFTPEPLTDEQIKTIVQSAQAASTSSFIQAYSIIGIKNIETKRKLSEITGNQHYVLHNGHFFIFCADLYRHHVISKHKKVNIQETLESTEKFMVALIDTALAAQNAAIAAESMGLGICYIGGIRNNLEEVTSIIKTPDYVIPLFGMAVGYPEQTTEQKPRLPFSHVYHEETYEQKKEKYVEQLNEYDQTISAYYEQRTSGTRKDKWTDQMIHMLSIREKNRPYMKNFVDKKGLNRK